MTSESNSSPIGCIKPSTPISYADALKNNKSPNLTSISLNSNSSSSPTFQSSIASTIRSRQTSQNSTTTKTSSDKSPNDSNSNSRSSDDNSNSNSSDENSSKSSLSSSSSSSASIRELSSAEFYSLQSENAELKAVLQQLALKIGHGKKSDSTIQRNNNLDSEINSNHQDEGQSSNNSTKTNTLDSDFDSDLDSIKSIDWSRIKAFMINDTSSEGQQSDKSNIRSSSNEIDETTSGPMIRQNDNNIIISNTQSSNGDSSTNDGVDDDDEKQVSVLEVSNSDWWTIVNPTLSDEAIHSKQKKNSDEMTDGFVIVSSQDACDALADYISSSVIKRHPEASRISPEELKLLLDSTLSSLRKPSRIGKIWQYGKSAYTTYGWISYAYGIYREPAMVGLAATTAIKIARYLFVMIL